MKIKEIRLDLIRTQGTQTRIEMDFDTVSRYCESYREGTLTKPLVVFDDGTNKWLGDGQHRISAAKKAKLTSVPCEVREGTKRDALLYSAGCNDHPENGLKRTEADKRNAVGILLADKEWGKASDRWISEQCHVSPTFVGKIRSQLSTDTVGGSGGKRKGKDGKERSVPKGRKSIADLLARIKAEDKDESREEKEEKDAEYQNELKRTHTDTSEQTAEAHGAAKEKAIGLLDKLESLFKSLDLDAGLLKPARDAVAAC